MAGHSKWANIKHRKNRQDAKKGKVFTKLIREITVAASIGGGDANTNPRLRMAIDKALNQNMTKDTIERAIKRGAGADDGNTLEEIRYEGYGPGGVALIIDCLTDNRNRTVAEIRYAFSKFNGHLGNTGAVSFLFKLRGLLCFAPGSDENRITEIALDAGAEDVIANEDGSIDVFTTPEDFINVKNAMSSANLNPEIAEISLVANSTIALDKETMEKTVQLIESLEDLDDVQSVYSNAEL